MIRGVGTDIVEIARIESSLERLGEAFANRILTSTEMTDFKRAALPNHFLAKRFAAKEAMGKALGTGIGQGVSWQHMEVVHDALGAPAFRLTDRAAERLAELGASSHYLSISDERTYAVAFVVISS